jgi:hypothetical protein
MVGISLGDARYKIDIVKENSQLHSKCFRNIKGFTTKTVSERFQPALDLYEKLTGFKDTNINAVMHHRISLYGPPCENCGKPLRTPQASFCAACGHRVDKK